MKPALVFSNNEILIAGVPDNADINRLIYISDPLIYSETVNSDDLECQTVSVSCFPILQAVKISSIAVVAEKLFFLDTSANLDILEIYKQAKIKYLNPSPISK